MINDIEFIEGFASELSEDYASAKSYVRDIPTQALVFVRSFTHKLTMVLAQRQQLHFSSPNLYDRIEQLNKARLIDVPTVRALHRLRGDGNRGAHPEKYHLTQEQLIAIAEKSIKNILQLIEKLYPQFNKNLPEYRFVEFDSLAGRDLCYRAVMQNDVEAQYLVGMSLKAKALMLQEQEQALERVTDKPNKDAKEQGAEQSFAQAAHWFALAAEHHHQALYEHGVSLLHGYQGQAQPQQGEQFIAEAAEHGVIDAKALLGYFYLVGSHEFEVELDKAKHWLELAAKQENAEAMSNLGVLYYQQYQQQLQSELDNIDSSLLREASVWITKAAESGYAHAQYHLSLMFESGEAGEVDNDKADYWLNEAAQHGQLDAMLRCASDTLNCEQATKEELARAEQYLHDVIRYGHNATAMIELSVALADGMLGRIDVVQSAYLLTLAKQYANQEQLHVIEPLWHSLLTQVNSVIELNPSEQELKALQYAKEILSQES
ncbi:DUF4145 domain-containing protein [Shewanella sp. WXL01]|uniref:tetratricopeptide repeat protein n=1 Tax=Shewanella sp. WXL01 TaxID=2709721 RepID=UPI001438409B|nr:tetratricopeptide repeat protein [Shewanella sp. WXL01]NKF49157.1 DUF4145 domain-containing protein [Shewanella sp. WXL01]